MKISYSFYRSYFQKDFNLTFGRPQIDMYCTCEELRLKIKSPHLSEAAKRVAGVELLVHRRRSRKFYSILKYGASEDAFDCFDCMQNVSLSKIPV